MSASSFWPVQVVYEEEDNWDGVLCCCEQEIENLCGFRGNETKTIVFRVYDPSSFWIRQVLFFPNLRAVLYKQQLFFKSALLACVPILKTCLDWLLVFRTCFLWKSSAFVFSFTFDWILEKCTVWLVPGLSTFLQACSLPLAGDNSRSLKHLFFGMCRLSALFGFKRENVTCFSS